jgi:uncharacterized protein involved in exopolysaccharide biosynthesis
VSTIENKQLMQEQQADEISLKDILAEIRLWFRLAWRKSWLILPIALAFGALGYYYAQSKKPVYTAELKFILKSDNNASSALSGLSSLLGSSSSASGGSLERIIELVGAEKVVIDVLFTKNKIGQQEDYIINQIYQQFQFKKAWQKDSLLKNFKPFTTRKAIEEMSIVERKALKRMIAFVTGPKGILQKNFDKKSGIISLNTSSFSEHLSIAITEQVYQTFVRFYINEASLTSNQNVDMLRRKVDSICNELYAVQRSAAVQSDQALGVLLQQDRVENKSMAIKEQMLTVMYAEAQKNFQTYQTTQSMNKPIFSLIEEPFSPIEAKKTSKLLFALLFAMGSGFITLVFIRLRIKIKNVLAS